MPPPRVRPSHLIGGYDEECSLHRLALTRASTKKLSIEKVRKAGGGDNGRSSDELVRRREWEQRRWGILTPTAIVLVVDTSTRHNVNMEARGSTSLCGSDRG